MKKNILKNLGQVVAAVTLAGSGVSVFAASTWVFGDNNPATECNAAEAVAGCVPQAGSDAGTPNVKVTAFSSTASSGSKFATATLSSYSGGLGVTANGESTSSPYHAMDNVDSTDLILLDFGVGNNFELEQVTIGWKGYSDGVKNGTGSDADISVFRYTGSLTNPAVSGVALTGMSAGGWELVGNYANLSIGTAKAVNAGNQTSSWWLISAYNANYGGNTATNLGGGNDYFKVLSVAGNISTGCIGSSCGGGQVPEPGSLALMGAAMMGLVASRRRKQQAD